MAQQQKIAEFQMVTGVDESTARQWLSQSSWTVDLAMDRYFNAGTAPPSNFQTPDVKVIETKGPSIEELLEEERKKKQQKDQAENWVLSRCALKWKPSKPKPMPKPIIQPVPTLPPPSSSSSSSSLDDLVPLKGVSVCAFVRNSVADVIVSQRFFNDQEQPMEAFFSFRQDNSSLYHFEAEIGGKTIVGVCKEKEKAFDKYDNAITSGHGAFLVEQGETSDSFKMNIGNLPPKKDCVVTVKYVTELETEGEAIRVNLPITRMGFAVDNQNNVDSSSDLVKKVASGFNLQMDLEMASPILGVECQTHNIQVDVQGNKAKVQFKDDDKEKDRKEMILLIGQQSPHVSSAVIERDETASTSNKATAAPSQDAVMLTFFPSLDVDEDPVTELIMLIDQSGSMAGTRINQAKNALQLFLRSLSEGTKFNIIGFGSSFHKLFPSSVPYTQDSLAKATNFVSGLEANLGGTDVLSPLKQIFRDTATLGNRQVLLLTDGDVSNTGSVLDLVRKHADQTRVFTFGIGGECSLALVKGVAQAARGHYEFVASGERIETKVLRTLKHVMQPVLADVKLDWGATLSDKKVQQMPTVLPPIFAGEKLVVYGLLPQGLSADSLQGAKAVLRGRTAEKEFAFEVDLGTATTVSGSMVHRLATRALVRDSEFDHDEEKAAKLVVPLATKYGIVSRFTSIVAVDTRSEQVEGTGAMVTVDVEQGKVEHLAKRNDNAPVLRRDKLGSVKNFGAAPTTPTSATSGGFFNAAPAPPPSASAYSFSSSLSSSSSYTDDDEEDFRGSPAIADCIDQTLSGEEYSALPSVAAPKTSAPVPQTTAAYSGISSVISSFIPQSGKKMKMKKESQKNSLMSEMEREEAPRRRESNEVLRAPAPPRPSPSANARPLDLIVLQQEANGSWSLANLLPQISLNRETLESAAKKEDVSLENDKFVATALAIEYIQLKFASDQEEWSLLVEKAKKWLRRETQKANVSLEKLTLLAKQLIK